MFKINIWKKGVSAVSPLYAALTARLMNIYGVNQVKTDFANGGYYKTFSFNDITSGSNGDFNASNDWDAVTGMGSLATYTPNIPDNETTPFIPSTTDSSNSTVSELTSDFSSPSNSDTYNTTIDYSITNFVNSTSSLLTTGTYNSTTHVNYSTFNSLSSTGVVSSFFSTNNSSNSFDQTSTTPTNFTHGQ